MEALQPGLDHVLRLVVAAALGSAIGLEREVHGHPAGLRTHLLVALGSALFTVLSIAGFGTADLVDPSRVAAQIVTGIGFLGAGAILKEGFTIRGLTTAASLWGSAAVGMAAGVGQHGLAVVATAIALVSLWPLHPIADRLERAHRKVGARVRIQVLDLADAGAVRVRLGELGVQLGGSRTQRLVSGGHELELVIRHRGESELYRALATIAAMERVTVISTEQGD